MEEAHTARLSRTLQELKDYADTLLVIKAKGDRSDQLPAACAAGTALLLRAREQERSAALHAARLKEDSASQRNKLDHDSLQLHNLVYEQQYYDKEIAACRAFASAYTEQQIGSVTLPQQQHEQELQRLTAELQQRQALQQQLQSLQHQKEQLLKERNRVSTSYAELRQQVEHCHSGNSALVSMTQPSRSSIQADAEAAQLLPLPLYIIYTQAAAAAGVVGLPLAVAIEGNPAIAKQQQQQQLSTQPGNDPQAATAAPDSKRRRKQLQQEDQAFQLHPLSVRLDMHAQESGSSQLVMSLTFSYYTQLKLVGVLAALPEDQELITNLFLGDVGDGLMLENVGVCSSGGTLEFAEAGRPCPFRWAQELGGVDVLASLPSSFTAVGTDASQVLSALSAYRNTLRLETFVDRIVAAKQGRQQLKRLLEQLALKEQPTCSPSAKVLGKINTYIHSWKHMSDVGVLQGGQLMQATVDAGPGDAPIWQPLQVQSIQEEGEVADGADSMPQLQHVATAEDDLLQGLLDDDRAATAEVDGMVHDGQQHPAQEQQQRVEASMLADGDLQALEAGGEFGDGYRDACTDVSAGSELLPGEDAADAALSGSSGADRTLMVSYSLYRLVLKAPAVEVHFHVRVYYNYPLCPPVFTITKMVDATQRGEPTIVTDVNEVLKLQQQANLVAVQDAAAAPPQMLALQILRLRQYLDAMSAQLRSLHSKDLVDNLKAKQCLLGRERRLSVLAC